MLYRKKLQEHVREMRGLGDVLVPYNFPKAPAEWEDTINILKAREITVDGYTAVVHYSKGDYDDHYLETLQILGKNSPFLPFHVVCKLAKSFLGEHELSLVEIFRENRKIYCWTLTVDMTGKPIPSPFEGDVEKCNYEGFEYGMLQPDQVNFH
jgi:hypothetical protein